MRVRWWSVLPLAVVVSVAGAVADLRFEGTLRWVFGAALALGCLLAVLGVSGPGLAAAMVEPPVVALLAAGAGTLLVGRGADGPATVLTIGTRLTTAFPVVAGVSGATLLVGLVRAWRGRPVARTR